MVFFGFFLSYRSEMRKVGHEKPILACSLPQEWGWAFLRMSDFRSLLGWVNAPLFWGSRAAAAVNGAATPWSRLD